MSESAPQNEQAQLAADVPQEATAAETQPAAEAAAPAAPAQPDPTTMTNPAPAADPDPLAIAQADIARLTAENQKLSEDLARVTAEHTQLHQSLDAERAKPSHEDLAQRNVSLKDQLERVTKERDLLKEQQPVATLEAVQSAPVELSDASVARIKDAVLEALAEHAMPVAEEPEQPPEAPQSPFISRGQ